MDTQDVPPPKEQMIRIEGFDQIIEMLLVADRDFRHSLLARIAQKDRVMAQNLIRRLKELA